MIRFFVFSEQRAREHKLPPGKAMEVALKHGFTSRDLSVSFAPVLYLRMDE